MATSNTEKIKVALNTAGYPTTSGPGFQGKDIGNYVNFDADKAYGAGKNISLEEALYGVQYPAVLPDAIATAASITKPTEVAPDPSIGKTVKTYNTTVNAAARNSGNLLVGTGIPATGFLIVTNGDIEIGVSLRYRMGVEPIPVLNNSPVTIGSTDYATGNVWGYAVSVCGLTPNQLITDRYEVSWVAQTEIGEGFDYDGLMLQWNQDSYSFGEPYPLGISTGGNVRVAQEVMPAAFEGRFVVGLVAVEKATGKQLTATIVVNAVPTSTLPPPETP